MKIKKYVANSMPEAMKLIRLELGSEAVILNSKIVQTGGVFGFFKKKQIEVIAAIDPEQSYENLQTVKNKHEQVETFKNAELEKDLFSQVVNNERSVEDQQTNEQLLNELSQLKKLVSNIESNNKTSSKMYPEQLQSIATIFTEQEIDEDIKDELMEKLLEKWFSSPSKPQYEEVLKWAKQLLKERIEHVSFGQISYDKKYINVVGPTGVGKTTTLAKMAARAVLKDKKKAAFITTDTYRIAAIDQLKTYAKILCVPLEVCYTADDFKKALNKFSDYEVVFIDTAGRNFRNEQYVNDLKSMIQFNNEMETLLVLALTAKQKDMEAIYEQFSKVNIDKFTFTKIDETANYGAIINMIDKYKIGVAYMTNGQDVPDDIIAVNPNIIINTIFGE